MPAASSTSPRSWASGSPATWRPTPPRRRRWSSSTQALALEWARYRIRVNAIAPGYIETDLNRDFFASDLGKALIARIPQRRLGQLEDLDGASAAPRLGCVGLHDRQLRSWSTAATSSRHYDLKPPERAMTADRQQQSLVSRARWTGRGLDCGDAVDRGGQRAGRAGGAAARPTQLAGHRGRHAGAAVRDRAGPAAAGGRAGSRPQAAEPAPVLGRRGAAEHGIQRHRRAGLDDRLHRFPARPPGRRRRQQGRAAVPAR